MHILAAARGGGRKKLAFLADAKYPYLSKPYGESQKKLVVFVIFFANKDLHCIEGRGVEKKLAFLADGKYPYLSKPYGESQNKLVVFVIFLLIRTCIL